MRIENIMMFVARFKAAFKNQKANLFIQPSERPVF